MQGQNGEGGHQLCGPGVLLQASWQSNSGEVQEGGKTEVWRGLLFRGQQLWVTNEEYEGKEAGGAANLLGVCVVCQEVTHVR